ncbi:MAG: glycosyltransferase [Archangiaceae bacterium]|nr:glycosyltransferase [Archangiaceae bacterium]
MRLTFVGTSRGARGTEQHLLALATAMHRRGHQVGAVVQRDGFLDRALTQAGIAPCTATFRNALDLRGWWGLYRHLARFRPHWVIGAFGHEYFPISVLGSALRCKVALFRHLNSPLNVVTRRVLPRFFRALVAVSKDMQGDLLAQGLPQEKVPLLYNPIALDRFVRCAVQRATVRRALGIADSDVLVGFTGAMSAAKGAPFLAGVLNQAMAKEPRLQAVWVGDAREQAPIRALLEPRHLARHRFLPWADDVQRVYPALDVLAVPSQWREPFGRVSVEAQACGVPVLASQVGGLPETLEPGSSGRLLPKHDPAAWVAALLELALLSAPEREAWCSAAVRAASRFDAAKIAEQFERLLTPA